MNIIFQSETKWLKGMAKQEHTSFDLPTLLLILSCPSKHYVLLRMEFDFGIDIIHKSLVYLIRGVEFSFTLVGPVWKARLFAKNMKQRMHRNSCLLWLKMNIKIPKLSVKYTLFYENWKKKDDKWKNMKWRKMNIQPTPQ